MSPRAIPWRIMMLDDIAAPVASLREEILDIWGRL